MRTNGLGGGLNHEATVHERYRSETSRVAANAGLATRTVSATAAAPEDISVTTTQRKVVRIHPKMPGITRPRAREPRAPGTSRRVVFKLAVKSPYLKDKLAARRMAANPA